MKDCLFCKIIDGDLPHYKVYEDNDYLAFLDINPVVQGHTLVIPKKHHRWVYDVENFGKYWEIAKKITLGLQKSLDPKFINYLTYGLDVPHAHIQILPRTEKDQNQIVPGPISVSKETLKETAKKIRNALK